MGTDYMPADGPELIGYCQILQYKFQENFQPTKRQGDSKQLRKRICVSSHQITRSPGHQITRSKISLIALELGILQEYHVLALRFSPPLGSPTPHREYFRPSGANIVRDAVRSAIYPQHIVGLWLDPR